MSLLTELPRLYGESKRNKWLRYFAIFCRIALALGFIPSGIVKVMGERFTALPANHPLGHYFDALYLTSYSTAPSARSLAFGESAVCARTGRQKGNTTKTARAKLLFIGAKLLYNVNVRRDDLYEAVRFISVRRV